MLSVSRTRISLAWQAGRRTLSYIGILTWHGLYFDHEGNRSRARPFHCTSVGLTSAITPNAGDSSA